jgi:hypothetical protein
MSGRVALAIVLAVLTAMFYALSNVLQFIEAEQVPDEYALRAGLIARLVRKPRWWLGVAADVVGYVACAAALALAAVVFVMPIVASGILIALFLSAAFTHRPVPRGDLFAAAVLSLGLAVFLYEVSPTGGNAVAPAGRWVVVGPILVVAVGVCIVCAGGFRGSPRGALLGIAAGISFGVAAVLTKSVVFFLGSGVFGWVGHWESYGLAVASIGGLLIAQSALQAGALGAAVGASEALIPITASALGIALLNEQITAVGARWIPVTVAIVAIVWSIVLLARGEQLLFEAGTVDAPVA